MTDHSPEHVEVTEADGLVTITMDKSTALFLTVLLSATDGASVEQAFAAKSLKHEDIRQEDVPTANKRLYVVYDKLSDVTQADFWESCGTDLDTLYKKIAELANVKPS